MFDIDDLTDEQIDELQDRLDERREEREALAERESGPKPINRVCIKCGYKVKHAGQLRDNNKYCDGCYDPSRLGKQRW